MNTQKPNELPSEIVRLNAQERIQHLLTFVTFVLLVVTGYMLRMPEEWILKFGGWGETIFYYRGITHRVCGVLMIATGLYHVIYLIACKSGRSFMFAMIPVWKDVTDIFQNLGYYLGLRAEPPKFRRFDYREKAEYLALVAGTIIISVTGIFLWTEVYWSKFVLDLSILIHGMEAILATLAIIVWHFYAVHWKPGQFPMSNVWIDGKMSNHHLKEEHAVQYEQMVADGMLAPVDESHDSGHGHSTHNKTIGRRLGEMMSLFTLVFCFVVSVLLLKILYFPSAPSMLSGNTAEQGKFVGFVASGQAKKTDTHFHNTDETVHLTIENQPICVSCHGTLPHSKSPDIRSFLNMHNYFMACETCHVRRADVKGEVAYLWYDNITEEQVQAIDESKNGSYGARMVPVASLNGKERRLDQPSNPGFIEQYKAQKDNLTPEEQAEAKVMLHKDMSKKPIQCTECHSREPYIDFVTAGYSKKRSDSLYRTEAADMIDRYMKFYLPTMFDPAMAKEKKVKELEVENRSTD
ncbi:MAG: cytochrome b/b6 domain-containing protein [Proteobacteria bacterium]|nr:cytochrome b/b6 domain-containing protein [Pseudomonadota bacterium]MBU1418148.1 cytochrome b/b6 domain-containing protein [Pseudomonadota bacterium]MBU1453256.1 cytochrome b/b6 domain-containing protein [Pseudomonadota bacterium]